MLTGLPGSFYPSGLKTADYLTYYATQFDTAEVDSLTVAFDGNRARLYSKTPPGFAFAANFPQAITHEKLLVDWDAGVHEFLATMDVLGEKLGSAGISSGVSWLSRPE